MINFQPGGASNHDIENPGQQHAAAVIAMDVSGSMAVAIHDLESAVGKLKEALENDPVTRSRVEVMLITFSDEARIVSPFCPVDDLVIPDLEARGGTNMHDAVDLAINEIEVRREQYLQEEVPAYKPFLFLLTDGCPTSLDNGAFQHLMDLQKNDRWNYFPVAVGPRADRSFLASNNANGTVMISGQDNFDGIFEFISDSFSKLVTLAPGEKAALPPADSYGMVVYQQTIDA